VTEPESPSREGTVVLDTNVLIAAAFRPDSHSGRLVQAVREGRYRLVWNEPTRRESERLMRRIPPISWSDVAGIFRDENHFTGPVDAAAFGNVPDPDDRKFAALAAAAQATLVSLDTHLLGAELGERPVVMRPGQVLGEDR
jgi:predicted nucleic acid-binding protein